LLFIISKSVLDVPAAPEHGSLSTWLLSRNINNCVFDLSKFIIFNSFLWNFLSINKEPMAIIMFCKCTISIKKKDEKKHDSYNFDYNLFEWYFLK